MCLHSFFRYDDYIIDERSFIMEQNETVKRQVSPKENLKILFAALAGLGIGGVLGVIAYYQQWLG